MNFVKALFNNNTVNKKEHKKLQNADVFIEKDAAPVDIPAYNDIPRTNNYDTDPSNYVDQGVTDQNDNYSVTDLVESRNIPHLSESNTLNVNSANQQLVMQISNVNSLHFGSVYNINNGPSNGDACGKMGTKPKANTDKGNTTKKTTTIDLMMKSCEEPSYKMLDTVATHLGSGWRHVMRELGFSEGQISSSELDHHIHGTKEVIYQLLLDWTRNADDKFRNIGYLTKLLWNCGQRECVQRMKITWKYELDKKNSQKS